MKRIKNKLIACILLQLTLSGCKHNEFIKKIGPPDINWQLIPNAPEDRVIKNIEISYNIPSALLADKSIEQLFTLKTFHKGTETKQEKLFLVKKTSNLWIIKRRTDNGASGSGVTYDVAIRKGNSCNGVTQVSFIVEREHKFQDGLIMPFAVPSFDIKKYLLNAQISYEFDVDSLYDKNSIQDNFQRLLGPSNGNQYDFKNKLATYHNKIHFYNYRGGTKIKIISLIECVPSSSLTVDVVKMINSLRNKIQNIVDS